MILHGFQERFLGDIRTALRGGARSVLAVAPTGSGKTVVMCHIARGIYEAGQSLLIVVHREMKFCRR
jgi:superfamily II DNA or RNA helicase